MDLAVRVVKVDGGRYRGRVEVGGVSAYTTAGAYGSRGEARDATVRMFAAGLGRMMAESDVGADVEGS